MNDYDLNIINIKTISISKTQNGVLQEPLFNPADINLIAYLEIVDNLQREFEYHLHIHKLDSKKDFLLTKGLYRNENNKITRPNSTSYVWHPNGDYIFYITTDAKRNVAYIDLKNLNQTKVNTLNTGIEFAEQISISPDGKYLAVMTQIAVGEDADALGQLFIVELTY
jgi:WD40 repeat protein